MRLAGAAAAALLSAACAGPATSVRPGDAGAPTVWRVRTQADTVTLSGTMTGWRLVPLQRHDGRFELRLRVPAGRHEYRLEARQGSSIRPIFPEDVERAPDGFGGENAVLRVP